MRVHRFDLKHLSAFASPETQRRLRQIAIAAILLVLVAKPSQAQSQQKLEVFAGYSYARTPLYVQGYINTCVTPAPCGFLANYSGTANTSGLEVSGAFRFARHWSAVADAGGTFGSASQNIPQKVNVIRHDTEHQYTYLLGPQISWHRQISPFAQALFGAAHRYQSFDYAAFGDAELYPKLVTSSSAQTAFAAAFGGGLDLNLTRHLRIRAIQFRELLTRFNPGTQYQPEISAGVLFHLP